ncbi:MAG: hypothetical protein HY563_04560 [Ignavibacteriales bacterium]|nr:hypothetical protein [Ignavibacteriales bacterium]
MEKRVHLRVFAALCFIMGLLLFLTQTRLSGVAPEVMELSVESSTVLFGGLGLIGIALALVVVSFLVHGEKVNKA